MRWTIPGFVDAGVVGSGSRYDEALRAPDGVGEQILRRFRCAGRSLLRPGVEFKDKIRLGRIMFGLGQRNIARAPAASPRLSGDRLVFWAGLLCFWVASTAFADVPTLKDLRKMVNSGQYAEAAKAADQVMRDRDGVYDEDWGVLHLRALLESGRYDEAAVTLTNVLKKESRSLRVRWAGREVALANGQPAWAAKLMDEVTQLVATRSYAYQDPLDRVAFGRAALVMGADPRRVMDRLFEPARKADPKAPEIYLARGELALEKHDFAVAAKAFQEGIAQVPDDPDLHAGLAKSFANGDADQLRQAIESALKLNSNHVGALLLVVDRSIDAEDYTQAAKLMEQIEKVNPWRPEMWAYRAVLARLQSDPEREADARQKAFKFGLLNPRVDHLIGTKLSQKYRFAEGSVFQRQALKLDKAFLPAKAQLAQDLMRLGDEEEGWKLANEVHDQDGYDVAAANLVTLRSTLAKFAAITNAHFMIRMSQREAKVYGQDVLDLVEKARDKLTAKYGLRLERPVLLEVFPDQKDFAVRTFGMPENHGFLGVCFGNVITANSPASRPGQRFNWKSTLWHEFCHVITLQLTQNRMPRWLSEGISVYEERQADAAWGQRMTPAYRERILKGAMTPIVEMSSAFMAPDSDADLQFAYYQSSLVVEFMIQRHSVDKLVAVLRDLGEGKDIRRAIEARMAPMAEMQREFDAFARGLAEQLGPGLDWTKPGFLVEDEAQDTVTKLARKLVDGGSKGGRDRDRSRAQGHGAAVQDESLWAAALKDHPTNFWALSHATERAFEAKDWAELKRLATVLTQGFPDHRGPGSGYRMLAFAHRGLGETNEEQIAWARLAEIDGEAADAYLRLMELAGAESAWEAVISNVGRYLANDPLTSPPYRALAAACEGSGKRPLGIRACRTLLELDPANPSEIHFQLARMLRQEGDPAAKRHLLMALEDAPRNRNALKMLRELAGQGQGQAGESGSQGTSKPAGKGAQ